MRSRRAVPAAAQQAETRIVEDAIDVFSALDDLPDREVPSFMVKDAWGVAIFPNLRKYGFVVGLQRGQGVMLARTKAGGWGSPLFVSLSGGTVGWQVGVQSVDLVLFFLTPESVAQALEGRLTLGVDVAVAAGGSDDRRGPAPTPTCGPRSSRTRAPAASSRAPRSAARRSTPTTGRTPPSTASRRCG